jgi:hypothetical protein
MDRRPGKAGSGQGAVECLNYESEETESDAGEMTRGIWDTAVAIAAGILAVLIAWMLVLLVMEAGSSVRTSRGAPLHSAAVSGNVSKVRSLIDDGSDPNTVGPRGETALVGAVREGHAEVVDELLGSGAEPTVAALNTALRYDRDEILRALIEAGGNPDVRSEWTAKSLLEIAAEQGDVAMARLLLEHGAAPDAAPDGGPFTTPALHVAARDGRTELVRLLLEHGANPDLTHQGWTAIETARNAGHSAIAEMMREAEEARDEAGRPE